MSLSFTFNNEPVKCNSGITLLIDMDVIAYQLGFAAQSTIYSYKGVDYKSKKSLYEAYPKTHKVIVNEEYDTKIIPDKVELCLAAVDVFINGLIFKTNAQFHRGFLTGDGNYRIDVATIVPYKGNRTSAKPIHHQVIRDHLVSEWGAEIIEGAEADDMLSIAQYEDLYSED